VSLVTKCVTGDFLQLTFNDVGREGMSGGRGRVGGWGQKVVSKPSVCCRPKAKSKNISFGIN
jgi:hypothetical protein